MKKSSQLKRNVVLLLTCAAAVVVFQPAASAPGEPLPNVDTILKHNFKAVRPNGSFSQLDSIEVFLRIEEGEHTLHARYRATSDGHMRIDVFMGDVRVFSEGKDEDGVWEWPGGGDGPVNVEHDGVGALEHGIEFNLFPLINFPPRGHGIELADREVVDDSDYLVLKITMSDGFETYRYVNADTWLIEIARDFRAFHPGVDDTKKYVETRYDEWAELDGVVFARRSQSMDLESGDVLARAFVLDTHHNRARDDLDLARHHVPEGAHKTDK